MYMSMLALVQRSAFKFEQCLSLVALVTVQLPDPGINYLKTTTVWIQRSASMLPVAFCFSLLQEKSMMS